MEIGILREYIALSRGLNVTKTARELNMAQSTLSGHIARLESDVGARLIDRSESPRLTPAGRALVETASDIVKLYDEFKERNKKGRDEEFVIIQDLQRREGVVSVLLDRIIKFKKTNPNTTFDIQEARSNSILEALIEGSVDCGYFGNAIEKPEVDDAFDLIPLMDEEFIVWMDKDSPLLEQELLSPRDLDGCPLPVPTGTGTYKGYLPPMYEELFSMYNAKANIKPRYSKSVDDFLISKIRREDMLILNRGSQIVEAMNEANGKVARSFNPSVHSTVYLAFLRENDPVVQRFKEHVHLLYEALPQHPHDHGWETEADAHPNS